MLNTIKHKNYVEDNRYDQGNNKEDEQSKIVYYARYEALNPIKSKLIKRIYRSISFLKDTKINKKKTILSSFMQTSKILINFLSSSCNKVS
jgi:hypothetical protein